MVDSDLLTMAHCPSDEPSEDIALANVGWSDCLLIAEDEDRCSDMVGDNPY